MLTETASKTVNAALFLLPCPPPRQPIRALRRWTHTLAPRQQNDKTGLQHHPGTLEKKKKLLRSPPHTSCVGEQSTA